MERTAENLPSGGRYFKYEQMMKDNKKLSRSVFLHMSDAALKKFFKKLYSLPSPKREEAFVQFCLFGNMNQNNLQ